jgi:hypothetical protein
MVLSRPDSSAATFSNPLLQKRLEIIVADLQDHPGCSLPQACRSRAALKAAYRFFDHPETSVAHLLPAFVRPAVRSLSSDCLVLVVHDSSSFNFTPLAKASGLGYISDSFSARGIHLHSSLLLNEDCNLVGLAHLHFWVRDQFRAETDVQIRNLPVEQKESFKWLLGIRAANTAFQALRSQGQTRLPELVHVMDREGDIHEVFAEVQQLGHHAVIRCCQNRRVEAAQPDQLDRAKQRVAERKSLGTMELCVPLKEGGFRLAVVQVRSMWVRLRPGEAKRKGRRPLNLWLIETREVGTPPAGEKAAQWWLWTMLPAGKMCQVKRVLQIYRARWRVEDYHRMLKTGCKVEKMRLQDAAALVKVIAMQAWVATQVLRMRDAAKQDPDQDCEMFFDVREWKMLWVREHGQAWQPSDGKPTLAEVAKWVGKLGGHLGRTGDGLPGAELLSRGLYALSLLLEGRDITLAEIGQPTRTTEAKAESKS